MSTLSHFVRPGALTSHRRGALYGHQEDQKFHCTGSNSSICGNHEANRSKLTLPVRKLLSTSFLGSGLQTKLPCTSVSREFNFLTREASASAGFTSNTVSGFGRQTQRGGTHLTRTYSGSLTEKFQARLFASDAATVAVKSEESLGSAKEAVASGFFVDSNLDNDDDVSMEDSDVIHFHPDDAGDDDDVLLIKNLNLVQSVEEALLRRGIERLFPIQKAVLEPSMEGRDVIARAKTGTGKTLAYGIPILQRLSSEFEANPRRSDRRPRCLVLAPTRELAKQVEKEFMESGPALTTLCVYGGVSIEGQMRQLRRGVDIVVGTPGRLIDLLDRGSLDVSAVQFVVLDEADQMLAVGFEEDVERIMEGLPRERQMSLFSATMPTWVKKLSRKYLNNPITIDLVGDEEEKLVDTISLMACRTTVAGKKNLLVDLITVYGRLNKTIVFTQTKRDADEVSLSLNRAVGCEALHGDIAQAQREKTLQAFRDNRFSVLVATDVAARGLDIPNVDLVIHYEIPSDPETFVHRTGRTGRAGKSGSAILMFTDNQARTLKFIEKDVGCKFEQIKAPQFEQVLNSSSEQAADMIARVHPELTELFLPSARRLIEERGGEQSLAAALAHLSGYTAPRASRSLITQEEGWVTLRIVRPGKVRPGAFNRGGAYLSSARSVLGALSELYKPAADAVGKIKLIEMGDGNSHGAVFDLPEDVAKEMLSKQFNSTDVIDKPTELPRLLEEFESRGSDRSFSSRSDRYGRSGERGERKSSFSRGGGERDRERGSGVRRGGERDRSFGRIDDRRAPSHHGQGHGHAHHSSGRSSHMSPPPRGGSSFSQASSGPYKLKRSLSTSGTSEWSGFDDSVDRSVGLQGDSLDWDRYAEGGYERESGGGRMGGGLARRSVSAARPAGGANGFSGVCFLCKQPGHRAVDCPIVVSRN